MALGRVGLSVFLRNLPARGSLFRLFWRNHEVLVGLAREVRMIEEIRVRLRVFDVTTVLKLW